MNPLTIGICCLTLSFLCGERAEAQVLENNAECYPLGSEEAMAILTNDEDKLHDIHSNWVVDKVGWGLTCLDNCSAGDLEVSEGTYNNGKCTYTITNVVPGDVMGENTIIRLKRKPL
ncbi:MAG: hypothetical protein JSR85_01335 [Proteobacteria bacterium]|nr:hypothetical protein [Pseudomonadota bacterium]